MRLLLATWFRMHDRIARFELVCIRYSCHSLKSFLSIWCQWTQRWCHQPTGPKSVYGILLQCGVNGFRRWMAPLANALVAALICQAHSLTPGKCDQSEESFTKGQFLLCKRWLNACSSVLKHAFLPASTVSKPCRLLQSARLDACRWVSHRQSCDPSNV